MRQASIAISVLLAITACGGEGDSGNQAVAPDNGTTPAPGPTPPPALAAPDLNRPVLASDPTGDTEYPVANFHRSIIDQGARFTLNGRFTGAQTTTQRQLVSRSALTASPTQWLNRSDLNRVVVSVERFENDLPGKSDIYADYFDASKQFVGDRTRGESRFRIAPDSLSKPGTARIGERGPIGRVVIQEPGSESAVGYRDITWEMLSLSDGTPAYCEKSTELDASGQVVLVSELCHGLDSNGQTNQRVTYSFKSGDSGGSLTASDFAMGPASSVDNIVDGAPFDLSRSTIQASERRIECLTTVDGPRTRGPLPAFVFDGDPVPDSLMVYAGSVPFKVAQGVLSPGLPYYGISYFDTPVDHFRWDSFERAYVGSNEYQGNQVSVLVSGKFDQQLRTSYYKEYSVDQGANTITTNECYDGVVSRLTLPENGPTSVLQCTGYVFPYRDVTMTHSLQVSGGRILVNPSDDLLAEYEIDLLLVNEHDQNYRTAGRVNRRELEALPGGWSRWTEKKIRIQQSQQNIVIEFDDQWNIRHYSRHGSDMDSSGGPNYFDCIPA